MLNSVSVFTLLVPFLLAVPASAARFITWNDIILEVADRPSHSVFHVNDGQMSVTQRYQTEYRIGLHDRQRKLHLNEKQFRVVGALFGLRMYWRSLDEIQAVLSVDQEPVENLAAEINELNLASRESFGMELIMEEGRRYKMAQSSLYRKPSSTEADTPFQFGESNRGFIYHGKWISVSESIMKLLQAVAAANGAVVPYQDLFAAVGKSDVLIPAAQNALWRLRKEVNRATIDGVGAPILGLSDGGLFLRVVQRPQLPDAITHHVGSFTLVLTPIQRHVFETLGLGQFPLGAKVNFDREQYFRLVLSPRRLKSVMAEINQQFVAHYGQSLVEVYSIGMRDISPLRWALGNYQHYYSVTADLMGECEDLLAFGPRGTWPGIPSIQ